MKTTAFRKYIVALFAVAGMAAAQASTFSVGGSGNTFTISRTGEGTNTAETVLYRTVPLSAFPGQHYTEKGGTLVFAPGQTGTNITVSAATLSNDAYRFQTGTSRSYRFEILDEGGFWITNATRSVTSGTSVPSGGAFNVKDVTIQSAEYTVDDRGYDKNGCKSVASSAYFNNAAPKEYYTFIGAQLRMTLSLDAKENDDAYEYLQLLFSNTSTCDNRSGANNGDPGTPSLSSYMAGFEMDTGSKDSTYRNYTFPVTNVANNAGDTNPWGYGTKYPLSNQKFKSNSRATDGRIVVPLSFSSIVLRLNASGSSGSDEWAAKNVKAHIQAVDFTQPTLYGGNVNAISVSPGPHCKGNEFYISIPFNEIVSSAGSKILRTTWGSMDYHSGDGSNVITFKGTVNAAANTTLAITNCPCTFKDLANNYFQGSPTKTFSGATVSASHAYPITYDLGGGTLPANAPTSYTYDAAVPLVQPTRTGYTFDGWTGSNGSTKQKSVTINPGSHGPRSYVAHWTPITYTITYDLAGGALPAGAANPETYAVTNAAFTLAPPVRTGYAFAGWTGTDLDGPTNEVTVVAGSTGDRSYVATWTANAYTVCFHANDGTGATHNQGFFYDEPQSLAPAFARTGYGFLRWTANADDTGDTYYNGQVVSNLTAEANGTVDLYAQWSGNSYSIHFDKNAGDADGHTEEMGMTYDVADNLNSNAFTRVGYDFAGWSTNTNGAVVYADGQAVSNLTAEADGTVTLYAQWTAHTYSVRFDANGGEGEMSDQLFTYDVATNLEANAFSRIGYDFAGWSTSENGAVVYADGASVSNLTAENHGSVTLYAQWTAHTYTVRFDANGGEGEMSDQVFTYDVVTNLDANVFTRTGYDFVGWSTSANGVVVYADGASVSNLTAEKCGSVTLYAQWTLHTYSVHFDANGGEGEMSDQVFTYDVVTNLPANVFSRTGYDFAGWSTSANGAVVYADGASVSNLTAEAGGIVDLYAQWTAHTYTVRFDRNAADATGEMADMQFTYDAPQALTSNAFARAGYTFAGWLGADSTTYPDGATVLNLTNAQDAVVTLVAQWRVNIPYIDADGNERICADYTVLTSAAGDVVYGAGGATAWYVVTNAVTISGRLWFCDDTAHLILCDGATLAVTNAFYAIEACNLAIYGQADSTGAVIGNGMRGIFCGGSVTINGGTVTAAAADSGCGIWASSLTINGGTVTAEGVNRGVYAGFVMINGGTVTAEGNSYGILAQNDITLGWTKPNDSITASSYTSLNGGAVYVKSRKYLTDGVEVYSGKLDDSQVAAIAGATLRPSAPPPLAYVDADGVERQCLDYVVIASGSDAATLGYAGEETWYAVTNNASISGGLKFLDKYAHIIVADGATLKVVNQDGDAVYAQKDLVVYGQSAGTGKLVAIGGGNGVYVEEGLVINHVIVNATGNDEYGIYSWGWAIGDGEVVINGATVTAKGGKCGFFTYDGLIINGGSLTASGKIGIHTDYTLTLNDGQIEASGDTHGIQSDEWLVANGGSVNAVGEGDSGIYAYNGIIVNDGTIVAEGGKNGLYVEFALFVNGGRVNATGGNCGVYAENGDITVVGGNATFTATLENRHGICAEEGDIILGWTNPTDSITLNGCYSEEGGVYVKKGRVLTDGADLYEGKIDLDDVASKTLRPYFSWESLQKMLDAGGTAVLPFDVTSADGDATLVVTNTVTLDLAGYAIDADGLFGVIEVREGGNLTLTNSVPESGAVTGGQAYYGGGVYVYYGGAFTMTGGTISDNKSDYYGGVYVYSGGTFTMTGGEISGNTAWQGGGVYVCPGGTFTMTGGEISGNTAYYDGGGVFVGDEGAFTMTGGEISGNTAGYGGGVYMSENATFMVSGSPVVSDNTNDAGAADNVYQTSGRTIAANDLSSGARIGVNTENAPTAGVPVTFASGAAEGDEAYFFSDKSTYAIEAGNGELRLIKPLTTWDVLQMKLNAGGTVTLTNDMIAVDGDATLTVTNTVTLDLAGYAIDADGLFGVIEVREGGNLTLTNSVPESGAITGGQADYGGGVYVYSGGTFTMTGGEISGNTAYCGGVYVGDGGAFTMTGGEISGNMASDGGGVYVDYGGAFTMTGGEISGNTAYNGGGGVYVCDDHSFTVSGSPVITGNTDGDGAANNVYLCGVMVVGELAESASIGVSVEKWITPSRPFRFTNGASAEDAKFFFSDNTKRFVEAGADGELFVKLPFTPWAALQALLDGGGVVTLTNSVVAMSYDGSLVVTNTVLLDLAGHTIDAAGWFCAIDIAEGGNLTLTNSVDGVGAITGGNTGVGIYDGGRFTMTAGAVSGNHYGGEGGAGGVNVHHGGTFTMTGGEIFGNFAAAGGGGVDVDGTFTMTGGTIKDNISDEGACGVEVGKYGLMEVSGRAVISGNTNCFGTANNVYLGDAATIAVVGDLEDGAYIGVTTDSKPMPGNPVTIATGAAAGDDRHFHSDLGIASVAMVDGEVCLVRSSYTQWETLQSRLDAGGVVALADDVVATDGDETLTVTNTVTLDLAGHTIDAAGRFGVIKVLDGGELTLTNSVEVTGAITGVFSHDQKVVYVGDGGAFTMAGGKLSGNLAQISGVYVDRGGAFTMTGGEISGNTANYVGGVYVHRDSTFTMTGGRISDNIADLAGGVYVDDDGTFAMTGGEISGNAAPYGGVCVKGDFTVSGSPVVAGNTNFFGMANNVWLGVDKTIAVSNLAEGASIGIATEEPPTLERSVTITSGAADGDSQYFFSDDSVNCAVVAEEGELHLAKMHSTQWEALQARLDEGGSVALTEDVVATLVDTCLFVTNTVLLDLNGHSLVGNGVYMVLAVKEGGELTLTNSVEGVGAIRGGYCREATGGGVYVDYGGAFTMTGGEISGNTADEGGGVYVNGGGTFTMTGGEISGNKSYCYGGGVYVDNDGTFTMSGGEISGNTASAGGGVFVNDNGAFTVSGNSVVSGNTNTVGAANNVYLPNGKEIAVDGLSAGASIGVTTETTPTSVEPVTFATGAAEGDEAYFFSDNPGCHVERSGDVLRLAGGTISPSFTDSEGRLIADTALVDWLMKNNFTQSDIDGLGHDAAATDRLYECWLLNCSITAANRGGALSITGFAVSTNHVSMTVQLVRHFPLGAINGELHLYGADDLSVGFGDSPIAGKSIDFGDGDSTFDTGYVAGPLTQSVTATFDARDVSYKFFKAKIDFPIREGQEEE